MKYLLSVDVYCAAGNAHLLATVILEGADAREIVLEHGRFEGELEARPLRLHVSSRVPAAPAQPRFPAERSAPKGATTLTASQLFADGGHALSADGSLALSVAWDVECHGELHVQDDAGKFGSYEHIQCALWIGRSAIAQGAEQLDSPFELSWDTALPLGGTHVTFGEVICLAGDFYAHLDQECAAAFADAWPALSGAAAWLGGDYRADVLLAAPAKEVKELLHSIHEEAHNKAALSEFASAVADGATQFSAKRRYLALASQNFCHFGSPDAARLPNEALRLYRGYHALALKRARDCGNDSQRWIAAVLTEGFACHFLSDLFASGHMRTPRRPLGELFGVLHGALRMSKAMHDEDNQLGLWCTTTGAPRVGPRVVWRAFGDGRLLDAAAQPHLLRVQEAVRRSVWELHLAQRGIEVAPDERAETHIPVPLPPGLGPAPSDVRPDGVSYAAGAAGNHQPLYALLANGHLGERAGGPMVALYRDLEDSSADLLTREGGA
jgi:hypothetical protein